MPKGPSVSRAHAQTHTDTVLEHQTMQQVEFTSLWSHAVRLRAPSSGAAVVLASPSRRLNFVSWVWPLSTASTRLRNETDSFLTIRQQKRVSEPCRQLAELKESVRSPSVAITGWWYQQQEACTVDPWECQVPNPVYGDIRIEKALFFILLFKDIFASVFCQLFSIIINLFLLLIILMIFA